MNKNTIIILLILALGVIFRLMLTANGNFIFNMDNARDFVDVREMMELKKLRLTGPSSAIEGLYNGPLWYYLLAIPYIISGGNPYAAILMEIILWVIGGFFLLRLVKNFGKWLVIPIGLVWVASNYVVLANVYSFNPNPIIFLTPFFIYSLVEYLKGKKLWIILVWFLAGAFFNFEMNVGIFIPFIILVSLYLINKKSFKDKFFWMGLIIFIGTLIPQLLFDLKHQFLMSKSVLKFLSENRGFFNIISRIQIIWDSYFGVFKATLMNQQFLSTIILILAIPIFKRFLTGKEKNITVTVSIIFILLPFFGYLIIPVTVNPWHLGGFAASSLVIIAFILSFLWRINFLGKLFALSLSLALILYPIFNINHFFAVDFRKPNMDPSEFSNEIAAIDYVYKYANGQNFKAYTYLPSVYDYPYQYLFWWYGLKNFGYLPLDYAYLPNRPKYIPSQKNFSAKEDKHLRGDSNLVFLIKEPNRNYTRFGWEGELIKFKPMKKIMVGPLEIEVRTEQ